MNVKALSSEKRGYSMKLRKVQFATDSGEISCGVRYVNTRDLRVETHNSIIV